jgi:asparagine synthase (glutamine-hydrolysing)
MCGFLFKYQPDLSVDELRFQMQAAIKRLSHRGPDDEGIKVENGVAFGHRRLSIIDLDSSKQPMSDESGRYTLIYNGEIYNYQELRSELESHWRFRTKGDTEVLLAGLVLKGSAILEKMEGMWAFALWDNEKRKLLLARDRMGKKPLYYHESEHNFLCGSELPAIECISGEIWSEDPDSTADFIRYGYYLPGTTAYMGIREVLPGYVLHWSPGSSVIQEPYWSLRMEPFNGNRKQACEELHDSLTMAIKKRLIADVEVGAFLSGGIDSSLVVSLLSKKINIIPKTFTIGFQDQTYDERHFADLMAKYCSTDHYVEVFGDWDSSKLTDLILNNVGQPFADSSLLPTALVSKVAASYVKVALSGDGGDELFSGYQRYQARTLLRWYTRLPKSLRIGIGRAIRSLPEPMAHHSRSILKKAHLFQDIIDRIEDETPYFAPVYYPKTIFNNLVPSLSDRGHQPPILPEECNQDDIKRMMTADALIYLPQDILLKVDRASMSYSLETRAPFLDKKVVELAFSLPRSWHRRGSKGKRMLQETFGEDLPDKIWNRRKQGFGVPIHNWFRKELAGTLQELLNSNSGFLNKSMVLNLLKQHRLGGRDHGNRLWSIYIYLLWKRKRMDAKDET